LQLSLRHSCHAEFLQALLERTHPRKGFRELLLRLNIRSMRCTDVSPIRERIPLVYVCADIANLSLQLEVLVKPGGRRELFGGGAAFSHGALAADWHTKEVAEGITFSPSVILCADYGAQVCLQASPALLSHTTTVSERSAEDSEGVFGW
jgi:hypothetical protein